MFQLRALNAQVGRLSARRVDLCFGLRDVLIGGNAGFVPDLREIE